MVTFGQSIREGYFNILSDSVLKLTGRTPRSLRSVLEQYQHTWPKAEVRQEDAEREMKRQLVALLFCPGVAGCLQQAEAACAARPRPLSRVAQVDDARLNNAAAEPQNWLAHGGDQQARRFSGLDQITPENISGLKPAWVLDFDTTRGQESTPVVVDGVIYVTTAWSKVYAVNAKTGVKLWSFDPKVPGPSAAKNCCDVVSRGAAVYHGKVYVGTYDGRLIALDAATGTPVWTAVTADPDEMYTISGAPRVGAGLVFIGNGGGEFGGRGYVTAYNADTGEQAWRFYTVPGDPNKPDGAASDEIMAKLVQPTWFGPYDEHRGGGMVWNSIVYDAEFDQVYLATGNGFPWPRGFRSAGKGDNLFICSVVAAGCEDRPLQVALPGNTRRQLGLRLHRRHDPRGPDHRRHAAQGADAHAQERVLLQHRSSRRKADLGRALCAGSDLGLACGHGHGSASGCTVGLLHQQAGAPESG